MSDPVLIALIAGAPGIITAVMSGVNQRKLNRMKTIVDQTGKNVNGRMDELLQTHGDVKYQQGVEAGKEMAGK